MAQKKNAINTQPAVKVGNISDISGSVNIAAGNITTNQSNAGITAVEIKQLFEQLYTTIQNHPGTSTAKKEDLKAEVQEVQATITEGTKINDNVDESSLSRHFRNIARMSPDILDVIVATLKNPLSGLGVVMEKIAQKAKEEIGAK